MAVLEALNDEVAQELLASRELARLAYTWRDGTPRVVPVWFHWTGTEVVVGSPSNAPKVKVLASRPAVAVTIDGSAWPYHTLLLRGTARLDDAEGIVPEYAAAAERYFGPEQGSAWVAQLEETGLAWTRIGITPTHATILDFVTRFPSALAG